MNEQSEFWKGEFGDEYTKRCSGDLDTYYQNQYGVTKTELNKEFFNDIPKKSPILECGCNHGWQLKLLKKEGFQNLWGFEINRSALMLAREDKELNVVEGSILDVPFKEGFFDLVFTNGVLIHVHPNDLPKAMDEMYRLSKKYILCLEYYSEKLEEIYYRGNRNKLWKNNFLKLFLERFPNLRLVKERKLKYLNEPDKTDNIFLMEKE